MEKLDEGLSKVKDQVPLYRKGWSKLVGISEAGKMVGTETVEVVEGFVGNIGDVGDVGDVGAAGEVVVAEFAATMS